MSRLRFRRAPRRALRRDGRPPTAAYAAFTAFTAFTTLAALSILSACTDRPATSPVPLAPRASRAVNAPVVVTAVWGTPEAQTRAFPPPRLLGDPIVLRYLSGPLDAATLSSLDALFITRSAMRGDCSTCTIPDVDALIAWVANGGKLVAESQAVLWDSDVHRGVPWSSQLRPIFGLDSVPPTDDFPVKDFEAQLRNPGDVLWTGIPDRDFPIIGSYRAVLGGWYGTNQNPTVRQVGVVFTGQTESPIVATSYASGCTVWFPIEAGASTGVDWDASPYYVRLMRNAVELPCIGYGNRRPVVSAGGPYTANEGEPIAMQWTASDPERDPLTFSWRTEAMSGFGNQLPQYLTFPDNPSPPRTAFQLQVFAHDGREGFMGDTTMVTVRNVAPSLGPVRYWAAPASAGSIVRTSAAFTDPGTADTHKARVRWDVRLPWEDATVIEAGGVGEVHATTITTPGIHYITLEVTDDDGGVARRTSGRPMMVWDPAAGYLTGSGTVAMLGSTASAPFDLLARWVTSPWTNTVGHVTLDAGNFHFRSTILYWLVIDPPRAVLAGAGTVGGVGDYTFELVAMDGGWVTTGDRADALRLRVVNRRDGELVFDNAPGTGIDGPVRTPLRTGDVTIHR